MNKNNHGFNDDFLMGEVDGKIIYLRAPSWDCEWYWGFGYLGNRDCNYHVDGLKKHEWYDTEKGCWRSESFNLYDGIKKHFGDSLTIKDNKKLWMFCELMVTFYTLKNTAEVLGRGGSHYTSNPCADIIKNEKEAKRINDKVIPAIFHELYELLKA
jgi:hypothetical protein